MPDDATSDVTADHGNPGIEEARRHLDPVVDHLSEKYPAASPDHVADVVDEVFTEISADARIPDHLAALTQHQAQERLHAEAAEDPDTA